MNNKIASQAIKLHATAFKREKSVDKINEVDRWLNRSPISSWKKPAREREMILSHQKWRQFFDNVCDDLFEPTINIKLVCGVLIFKPLFYGTYIRFRRQMRSPHLYSVQFAKQQINIYIHNHPIHSFIQMNNSCRGVYCANDDINRPSLFAKIVDNK